MRGGELSEAQRVYALAQREAGVRTAHRNGYTTWSYTQALEEGLQDYYSPSQLFMQDNAPIHTAYHSREWLETHRVAVVN